MTQINYTHIVKFKGPPPSHLHYLRCVMIDGFFTQGWLCPTAAFRPKWYPIIFFPKISDRKKYLQRHFFSSSGPCLVLSRGKIRYWAVKWHSGRAKKRRISGYLRISFKYWHFKKIWLTLLKRLMTGDAFCIQSQSW